MTVRVSDEQLAADLALAEATPAAPRSARERMPAYLRELQEAREALRDLVAWADEQEAMTGSDAITSLLLRIERAREVLGGGS